MRKPAAAAGSAVFFLVAPGTVLVLIPWWITHWRVGEPAPWPPLRVAGAVLLLAAVAALVWTFSRFVTEGRGTPAPVAAPEHLVVGGLYRYVRNPMYVAVLAGIVGQALILGRPVLLLYAAAVWVVPAAFVHWYEEPELARRFGAEYEEYRRAVPAWLPRLRPWRPGGDGADAPGLSRERRPRPAPGNDAR